MSGSWESHWLGRLGAYAAHRAIAGPTANTLIGNSIIEGFWWNTIGACRVVNAGLGGAPTKALAERMANFNVGSTPRYVVVMTGTNDAIEEQLSTETVNQFSADLQTIIDTSKARGATVLLASVPPIEPGKSASDTRFQFAVNQLNHVIVYQKCQPQGLKLINLNYPFYDNNTGVGKVGYTTDGIHFTRASYVELYNQFNTALQAEIARTGKSCA